MRRFVVLPLVAVAVLFGLAAPRAEAALIQEVTCDTVGQVFVTIAPNNSMTWRVSGSGRCLTGDQKGPYTVTFQGTGTSATDGFCKDGGILVKGLDIAVTAVLDDVTSPATQQIGMHWVAPVTNYPRVTPFLVNYNGLRGAGSIETAKRGCTGMLESSGAVFDWTFLRKL
jgi:hypothetical protein